MRPFRDLLETANSRPRIIGIWFLLIVLLALLLAPPAASFWGVTKSTERGSYFFRLKAKYTHEGQPIDFDIVVACSIRVDRYRGGDSGFLASRYPRFFVKRTHDNHAVMQIVPIACRGESTEDGRVPEDFLPGVIWFDKPGDYRFGIAYVSEDAFENPKSQLKFHGASIERATRADWEEFRKRAADNEGMRRRYYDRTFYTTEEAKRIAEAGGKEVEAAFARGCRGVARYRLSEAARAVVRRYWAASRPTYWAMNSRDEGPWPELIRLQRSTPIFSNGLRFIEHLNGGNYNYGGFPTKSRGGMIDSHLRPKVPPEIYPSRFDLGIPWVFSSDVANSTFLVRGVEIENGFGKGFLYCFTTLNPGRGRLDGVLPNLRVRESRVRVDDEWVVTPDPKISSWPSPFFERDEFMYVELGIGLS